MSLMAIGRVAVLSMLLSGCFEHHVLDERGDASPDDVGRCFCSTDSDCPRPEGCFEVTCDGCLCQRVEIPGCAECSCVSDSDCPAPPPFGDCVRSRCEDCVCTFRPDNSLCLGAEVCDLETLMCRPNEVVLEVVLRTDLDPETEFNLVDLSYLDEYVGYRPNADDDFETGVVIGRLGVPADVDVLVAMQIWLDDVLVANRESLIRTGEGARTVFVVSR